MTLDAIPGRMRTTAGMLADAEREALFADFSDIEAYWRDPAPFEAEREAARAQCHVAIDRGMAAVNARQAERWAREQAA